MVHATELYLYGLFERGVSKRISIRGLKGLFSIEHMKWIASDLMSLASSSLSGLDIDLRIFVTNEADSATASVDELSKNEKDGQNSQSSSVEKINHETSLENDRALESLLQSHPNITCTISCQRPIVTNILKQEISVSKGHVSVHGNYVHSSHWFSLISVCIMSSEWPRIIDQRRSKCAMYR